MKYAYHTAAARPPVAPGNPVQSLPGPRNQPEFGRYSRISRQVNEAVYAH
jgi:hypothetical protein